MCSSRHELGVKVSGAPSIHGTTRVRRSRCQVHSPWSKNLSRRARDELLSPQGGSIVELLPSECWSLECSERTFHPRHSSEHARDGFKQAGQKYHCVCQGVSQKVDTRGSLDSGGPSHLLNFSRCLAQAQCAKDMHKSSHMAPLASMQIQQHRVETKWTLQRAQTSLLYAIS